ncbi:MAG TPA: hypothetical protein VGL38_09895 [bacterium]|jgi:hypothetical protein
MRIEGYPPLMPSIQPAGAKTPAHSAKPAPEETLTAQEKLARLLDEKRWMSDAAFGGDPEGELGKHIDLRV